MTLDEIIRARRSIRKYDPHKPVDPAALQAVLEAGRLAPSARNRQEWHFTAVTNAALRTGLMAACMGQQQVADAPVDLVVWSQNTRVMQCGQSTASIDCSIALSFMMLKAAELGLGTCWLGAFNAEEAAQLLQLPQDATIVAITPLGYPAEAPEPRPRKALAEISDIRE